MNKEEYLLTCLQEECAEVIKICSKIKRFGWENNYPGAKELNVESLNRELHDILAVVKLLSKNTKYVKYAYDIDLINDKINKTTKYMRMSEDLGLLDE